MLFLNAIQIECPSSQALICYLTNFQQHKMPKIMKKLGNHTVSQYYLHKNTFWFGIKITNVYNKSILLDYWRRMSNRLRLLIIKLFHICTKNQNLEFLLRSKMLYIIAKKLVTKIHTVQQTMPQNSFKQIERGETYFSICWWSIHYKEAFFHFWKVFFIFVAQDTKILKRGWIVSISQIIEDSIIYSRLHPFTG